MSGHRITRKTAELVAIPPTTWTVRSIKSLLEEESIVKNIYNVGLNQPLLESLKRDGMMNPILVMPTWYPIVGSQRIRVFQEIKETEPEHPCLDQLVRVARFEKEYWNMYYLWGADENFRSKAIAVWFQTVELAWKSIHYMETEDKKGFSMQEFEEIGDRTKWNISEENRKKYAFN